jgi:hypothetical protein
MYLTELGSFGGILGNPRLRQIGLLAESILGKNPFPPADMQREAAFFKNFEWTARFGRPPISQDVSLATLLIVQQITSGIERMIQSHMELRDHLPKEPLCLEAGPSRDLLQHQLSEIFSCFEKILESHEWKIITKAFIEIDPAQMVLSYKRLFSYLKGLSEPTSSDLPLAFFLQMWKGFALISPNNSC